MADTKKRQLRTLPGLRAEHFQHPLDVEATKALEAIPGMSTLVAKVVEYGFERVYYLENLASNVRVGENMFGRLHRSLRWACKILDVEEPELYVSMDPVPNAYTYGHNNPFIVMTSGLIDMLDDEERFFVLAHELGHIKAGHVLYTIIARNIGAIASAIGMATLGIGKLLIGVSLELALYKWMRSAELTADRAGMLCTQTFDPCLRTFMKLAGGASRLYDDMNPDAFLEQARNYQDADIDSDLNKIYKVLLTAFRSHPFAVMRAKELDDWSSGGYDSVFEQARQRE